jgi:CheY-like chemotaxis protein
VHARDAEVDPLSITILLVEDSRLLRLTNERALAKAGYTVLGATDGEEGLEIARQHMPNLVLLDMVLPKLDGVAVLRALKADPQTKNIPVIVLSGLSEKNEAKLRREGAAAYFIKSDSLLKNNCDTLLRLVERVLGKLEREGNETKLSAPLL